MACVVLQSNRPFAMNSAAQQESSAAACISSHPSLAGKQSQTVSDELIS